MDYTLAAGVSVELMMTTQAAGAVDLTGNELANTIYGNNNVNVLGGAAGNDVLAGQGGSDTLNGGADADTLFGGNDADTLNGDGEADKLCGEAGDDTLNGGAGADRLEGGAGQNDMAGGTGDDTYIVSSTTDTVTEGAGGGTTDRVYTSVNFAGGEVFRKRRHGDTHAIITTTGGAAARVRGGGATQWGATQGGDGDDTLNGGNNNDILLGEAGETYQGGAGTDRWREALARRHGRRRRRRHLYRSSTTDTVAEGAGGGTTDRVYSSVNFALTAGAQVEFLATTNIAGTGALNLTGNEFANAIYGNNGANIISGKGGKDTLTGFGGPDLFVFDTVPNTATNFDVVTDFNGAQDNIRLAKSAFAALTGAAGTTLSADQFVVGLAALDANDRIIYNNGTLNYDSNGNLAGGVQVIAFLPASRRSAIRTSCWDDVAVML